MVRPHRSAITTLVAFGVAVSTVGGLTSAGAVDGWAVPRRASGILQSYGRETGSAPSGASSAECSLPGGGNWLTDCVTYGAPVNEPSIAYRDGLYVAGSNNYNSYNRNSQLGFF
jgi:hypothetical protein